MTDTNIITFGCRLNTYESEVMKTHMGEAGLGDTVIVNTCAVTNEAVRQARQTIRRTRREQPNVRIVVTGCAAQIDPGVFADMAEVDHVIGNEEKLKVDTYHLLARQGLERVQVNDIMSVRETAGHLLDGFGSRARAYVQIQNGCDHRCTFCIIPFGRGNSRSVPAGELVDQISQLVDRGFREVVLTGVDITSYGFDLPGALTLGGLVAKILKLVPDLCRLRLSSIDSIEVDDALLRVIETDERLMPHLHLSLQSGDNLTLKRMKRRHSRNDSVAFCKQVRERRPDMVFGADLIAGFPTETDEMFQNTMRLVNDCGLTFLHVFPYSARPGTPAARMPQVAGATIKQRAGQLRAKASEVLGRHRRDMCHRDVDLLMERVDMGRLPQFTEVYVRGTAEPGEIVRVRITEEQNGRLTGDLLA